MNVNSLVLTNCIYIYIYQFFLRLFNVILLLWYYFNKIFIGISEKLEENFIGYFLQITHFKICEMMQSKDIIKQEEKNHLWWSVTSFAFTTQSYARIVLKTFHLYEILIKFYLIKIHPEY